MVTPSEVRSYPKMIFGNNVNLLTLEERIFEAELVVCDMAGTTICDGGLVLKAFRDTAVEMGIPTGSEAFDSTMQQLRDTMGQSKIIVFHQIFNDESLALLANNKFEDSYKQMIAEKGAKEVPGTSELFSTLRARLIKIALTTDFDKSIQDLLIYALGWSNTIDAAICPTQEVKGRPEPDMIELAMKTTGIANSQNILVVGDTVSDIKSGRAAGAGLTIGVLSGAHSSGDLLSAGADLVLESILELTTLIYAFGRPVN